MTNKQKEKLTQEKLDDDDLLIEKGDLDPVGEKSLYPKGVLNVLGMVFRNKVIFLS